MANTPLTPEQAIAVLKLADNYSNDKKTQEATLAANVPQIEEALALATMNADVRKTATDMVPFIRRYMSNSKNISLDALYHLSDAAKAAGEKDATVSVDLQIGIIAHERGDNTHATEYLQQGLVMAKELNNPHRVTDINYRLGDIALSQKDYTVAKQYFSQSADMAKAQLTHPDLSEKEKVNFSRSAGDAVTGLGEVQRRQGNYKGAAQAYQTAIPLYKEGKFDKGVANDTFALGQSYMAVGDSTHGLPVLIQSFEMYSQLGYNLGIAQSAKTIGEAFDASLQKHPLKNPATEKAGLQGAEDWYHYAENYYNAIGDKENAAACAAKVDKLEHQLGALPSPKTPVVKSAATLQQRH